MSKRNFLISTEASALSITCEQARILFEKLDEHFGRRSKKSKHKKSKHQ